MSIRKNYYAVRKSLEIVRSHLDLNNRENVDLPIPSPTDQWDQSDNASDTELDNLFSEENDFNDNTVHVSESEINEPTVPVSVNEYRANSSSSDYSFASDSDSDLSDALQPVDKVIKPGPAASASISTGE